MVYTVNPVETFFVVSPQNSPQHICFLKVASKNNENVPNFGYELILAAFGSVDVTYTKITCGFYGSFEDNQTFNVLIKIRNSFSSKTIKI